MLKGTVCEEVDPPALSSLPCRSEDRSRILKLTSGEAVASRDDEVDGDVDEADEIHDESFDVRC